MRKSVMAMYKKRRWIRIFVRSAVLIMMRTSSKMHELDVTMMTVERWVHYWCAGFDRKPIPCKKFTCSYR